MAVSCYDNPCHLSLILSDRSTTELRILRLVCELFSCPPRTDLLLFTIGISFFALWYPVQLYLLSLVNWFTYGMSIVFLMIPVNTFLYDFLYSDILHNLCALFLCISYNCSHFRTHFFPCIFPIVYLTPPRWFTIYAFIFMFTFSRLPHYFFQKTRCFKLFRMHNSKKTDLTGRHSPFRSNPFTR